MALVRTAVISSMIVVSLGAVSSAAIYYKQNDEISARTALLASDRSLLAFDKGLVLQEKALRREVRVLGMSKGEHAKRMLIDRARAIKAITVRDFTLDQSGTKFAMKIGGKYGDIVAASVSIPASDPGVSLQSLRIDADSSAGHDNAVATLTGEFVPL